MLRFNINQSLTLVHSDRFRLMWSLAVTITVSSSLIFPLQRGFVLFNFSYRAAPTLFASKRRRLWFWVLLQQLRRSVSVKRNFTKIFSEEHSWSSTSSTCLSDWFKSAICSAFDWFWSRQVPLADFSRTLVTRWTWSVIVTTLVSCVDEY